MASTLLLIDDDRNITTSLRIALEGAGYHVQIADNGEDGLKAAAKLIPDLIILDVKMPRLDGFEVLERLRAMPMPVGGVPVIMLTSKDDEVDEALGFRLGADDYVAKPFSQRLLLARIEAVLRRHQMRAGPSPEEGGGEGAPASDNNPPSGLGLDPAGYRCMWDGQPVLLTVTEFLIVQSLADRLGHVKSRDQLIDAAYGETQAVDDRVIDTHIKRIRRKFRDAGAQEDIIETVYGAGYRLGAGFL